MLVFLAFVNSAHYKIRAAQSKKAVYLAFDPVRCLDTSRESHVCSFYLALLFNFTFLHRDLGSL